MNSFASILFSLLMVLLSLGTTASLATSLDVDLAKALEKAAKGELRERDLLQRLERGFANANDFSKQIQIAGVLTYAPESSGLRERYVDFLLGNSRAETILGKREMFRLHRLKAERLFEAGKFSQSRPHFEYLMQVSDPLVREYAVLKAGWCYMNEETQHLAWQLWIEQAEKTISEKHTLPPNLAHSLGQALVENPKRTSEDFARLGELKMDPASLQSVIHGMEQGADVVDSAEKMKLFVGQASSLTWSGALAERLLEQMGGTGSRACLFLPWVTLMPAPEEVTPLAYQVSESCVVWLAADSALTSNAPAKYAANLKRKKAANKKQWENITRAATEILNKWVPAQKWSNSQLRVPFSFYSLMGHSLESCEVGLRWISEPGAGDYRTRAPVAEITNQCKKAAVSEPSVLKIARYFEPTAGTLPYLSNPKDPLLFVTMALLEQPAFEKMLLDSLRDTSKHYEATLLPVLVLEKLENAKQYALSESLWEALVQKQADDPTQSSAWRQVLQRRMKQLTDSKAPLESIRALLEKTLLAPNDPKLSEFGYNLWLQYLALEVAAVQKNPLEAEKKLSENAPVRAIALALLSKSRAKAFPKLGPPTVEMMAWFSMWNPLWETVSGTDGIAFSAVRSEALEVRLLSAIVRGEITPASNVTTKDASLNFILELGLKLKEDPNGDWLYTLKPAGKGVVARDALFLQALAKRQKNLLIQTKGSKAAAKQALDWINFMDEKKREIGKRTWSHEVFFFAAQNSIMGFCEKASDRLPALKESVQGAGSTEAQWREFFAAFDKKLEQCRKKSDSRKASL